MENQNEMQPFISSFKFIKICSIIILWLITIGHLLFALYIIYGKGPSLSFLYIMLSFYILLIVTIIETIDINKPLDSIFSTSLSILIIYQIIITIIFGFLMLLIIGWHGTSYEGAVIVFIYIIESCPLAIIICNYYCYKRSINKNLQNLNNLNNNGLLQGI